MGQVEYYINQADELMLGCKQEFIIVKLDIYTVLIVISSLKYG